MTIIKLQTESIKQVPLDKYPQDFIFDVNGEKNQTTKLIADLLSPKISKLHFADPTVSEYSITTQSKGNFSNILSLSTLNEKEIDEKEEPFISEIIEKLEIQYIDINSKDIEFTEKNAINHLLLYEKSTTFYKKKCEQCINFICQNFPTICDKYEKDLIQLSEEILEKIISNQKLVVSSEDQLLRFVNDLYIENPKYSRFYEYVYFENVDSSTINEFIDIFDFDTLTSGAWKSLCRRLSFDTNMLLIDEKSIRNHNKQNNQPKYLPIISFKSDNLKGIFNHFRSKVHKEFFIYWSSLRLGEIDNLINIENKTHEFYTDDKKNSLIGFEFKKHKIIFTGYTIRTPNSPPGERHLRNWVIEGSNDLSSMEILDEQKECNYLNGNNYIHTFPISKQNNNMKPFKYFQIRQTGPNWSNNNVLYLCSIEFYGHII